MWPYAAASVVWNEIGLHVYKEFHGIHNVVDRGVLQAMWEELAGKVGHRDQLLSANHAYLKTLYTSEVTTRAL